MYQPNVPPPPHRCSNPDRSSQRSSVIGLNRSPQQQSIRQLPRRNAVPVWLKSLLTLQRGVKILSGGVLGLSLIVYAYTIHTQNSFTQQYSELKELKKHERQRDAMTAILSHQAAEQPRSDLIEPNTKQPIFMTSAPQRPSKTIPTTPNPKTAPMSKTPLGY